MYKVKIYAAGSGGMLGEAIGNELNSKFDLKMSDLVPNKFCKNKLDFRNFNNYLKDVSEYKPDFLFHIGALTDLEYCEINPTEAYETNTLSAENAVIIANKLDIPLIFISTAGIFDGKKEKYDDWDIPNPLSHYGRSKYLAENYIKDNCKKYYIFRAGWMMGGGPEIDKKFINKIFKQLKDGQLELNIVDDKIGTPTYTYDFINNLIKVIETEFYGVYNMVCNGDASRYEVCEEILTLLNINKKIKLNKVASNYFSKQYFAKRPKSEALINKKLNLRSLNYMRDWKICLNEYINKFFI